MAAQRFLGRWGERECKVEVERTAEGRYVVTLDGEPHTVDGLRFETGNWSLIIDGQSYDVELEQAGTSGEGRYNTLVRGHVIPLTIQDERKLRMAQTTKKLAQRGPQVMCSPMPGKVVKILVESEQEVAEDQPVVIIEAMKMENELFAPTKAKVGNIFVKEGQAVEANARLIELLN